MKSQTIRTTQLMAVALSLAAIFLLPPKASSQDTVSGKQEKLIKVRIDMDEGGESISIDTTFLIDQEADLENFEQAMQQYELQMKKLENRMDKARKMTEMRNREFRWHPEDIHAMCCPPPSHCIVRPGPPERGETLSDVLGEIPMRAVKSYKVKDTKDGKRITIEISGDLVPRPPDRELIFMHRERPEPPPGPRIRKEIRIEREMDIDEPDEVEGAEEPGRPVEPERPAE